MRSWRTCGGQLHCLVGAGLQRAALLERDRGIILASLRRLLPPWDLLGRVALNCTLCRNMWELLWEVISWLLKDRAIVKHEGAADGFSGASAAVGPLWRASPRVASDWSPLGPRVFDV
mmetsp:Transcript_48200/g.105231  ORF Transcript_48200/g.105231 Transcript_48200/m.105231 type:complete len:118 (+) Transcript_48200:242-595(+)